MKFCSTCGNQIADGVKTCPQCGGKQKASKTKKLVIWCCAAVVTAVVLIVLIGLGMVTDVQDDFMNYHNNIVRSNISEKLKEISGLEKEAFKAGTAEEFKERIDEDVLPLVRDVYEIAKDADIKTKEVEDVNKLLVSGLEKLEEYYELYTEAVVERDEDKLKESEELKESFQKDIADWEEKHKDLMDEYGMELEYKD
ncbi:MAG: zinc-ribbon domain-containing protein [Ruminococcaceae bacterium]|nr:zinc-ribbon domain-containing protein [Oscillospiraceae bacterium]